MIVSNFENTIIYIQYLANVQVEGFYGKIALIIFLPAESIGHYLTFFVNLFLLTKRQISLSYKPRFIGTMPNILCKWIPSAIIKQENKYHYLNNSYNHKENEGVFIIKSVGYNISMKLKHILKQSYIPLLSLFFSFAQRKVRARGFLFKYIGSLEL